MRNAEYAIGNEEDGRGARVARVSAPRGACALLVFCLLGAVVCLADRKADELFEEAMGAYRLKRYEDAADKFYNFLSGAPADPRNDQAQYFVGRSLMHRNFLNKAVEEYGYLIADFPKSPYTTVAMHDTAQCCLKTRRQDLAVEWMEKAIARPVQVYAGTQDALLRQLYENHRSDIFWLAKHYVANKQHDAAIAAYRKLPREMDAFQQVVNVYYNLGLFEKIRELIDGLAEKNRHQGFRYLIEFYGKSKAFNQLEAVFTKLLAEKEPDRATDDLVWTSARSFQNLGNDRWEWALRRMSASYPRLARKAEYTLARTYWSKADYQNELELFVMKYKSGSDVNSVLRWKGIVLERNGEPVVARKEYRRLGDRAEGHWYSCESFHGRYAREKDLPGAMGEYRALRKAFYAPEWSAMAQWRIAELHSVAGDVDAAVEAYRHAEKRFRSLKIGDGRWSRVLQSNLGRQRLDVGPESQLACADLLRGAGRYDDSIMEYRTLVARYPKTAQAPVAAFRTALCYEGKNDPDTAIKVMKSVLRRYPKSSAASEAHTRLETKYGVADTEIADDLGLDFFDDVTGVKIEKSLLDAQ